MDGCRERLAINSVAIAQQVAWRTIPGEGLDQLPGRPFCGGMRGYACAGERKVAAMGPRWVYSIGLFGSQNGKFRLLENLAKPEFSPEKIQFAALIITFAKGEKLWLTQMLHLTLTPQA